MQDGAAILASRIIEKVRSLETHTVVELDYGSNAQFLGETVAEATSTHLAAPAAQGTRRSTIFRRASGGLRRGTVMVGSRTSDAMEGSAFLGVSHARGGVFSMHNLSLVTAAAVFNPQLAFRYQSRQGLAQGMAAGAIEYAKLGFRRQL